MRNVVRAEHVELELEPRPKPEQHRSVPRLSNDDVGGSELRAMSPPHVLLIEDDIPVAKSLKGLLELGGFLVDHAADGEAGLALARSGSYAAIVLDRVLPKLSGDRVLECLKGDGNRSPVLILTGFPDADSAFRAGLLRATSYLQKGRITGAELCAAVSSAIDSAAPVGGQLFSAYGGHSSPSCASLIATLSRGTGMGRSELLPMLAEAMVFADLTFVEFAALAKAMRT